MSIGEQGVEGRDFGRRSPHTRVVLIYFAIKQADHSFLVADRDDFFAAVFRGCLLGCGKVSKSSPVFYTFLRAHHSCMRAQMEVPKIGGPFAMGSGRRRPRCSRRTFRATASKTL